MNRRRRDLGAAAVAAVAAVAPFVVATTRAIRSGWYPIGDNAFFALRARDVFTDHHPLLGTWTSASLSVGRNLNNPGPLLFDLLAIPAKVSPAGGLAAGVALVNVASLATLALLAWRRGGPALAAWALAAGAGLAWTMGSELLFDPWQPNALLFPFLAFLVAVWSMVEGDIVALPIAVGLASLVVQTHLSYAVLVPLLAVVGVAGLGVHLRRRTDGPGVRRPVAATCWVQPLLDQVRGVGNLETLLTNASSGDAKIGAGLATQLAAWVLATPPFWGRSSFARALYTPGPEPMPGRVTAAISLVALVLVLVLAIALGKRRGAAVVALAAVLGSWLTTALLPLGTLGIVPHQFKWLWPVGVFATFAIVVSLTRHALAGAGFAVVLGLASLPAWNARSGPSADAASIPTARALARRLDLGGVDRVLFDPRGLRFAEPYSTVVLLELQLRGIDFRVDEAILGRQVGRSRVVGRAEAAALPRLVQREGDAVFDGPPGGRVVSRVVALSADERRELDRLETVVATTIEADGLVLNERGRDVQRQNGLPSLRTAGTELRDPGALLGTAELIRIVREDLASIPRSERATFRRYAELQHAWNTRTVALFLLEPAS